MDRSVVSLSAVTPNLPSSVALLADVVQRPTFDAAELERLRDDGLLSKAAILARPPDDGPAPS